MNSLYSNHPIQLHEPLPTCMNFNTKQDWCLQLDLHLERDCVDSSVGPWLDLAGLNAASDGRSVQVASKLAATVSSGGPTRKVNAEPYLQTLASPRNRIHTKFCSHTGRIGRRHKSCNDKRKLEWTLLNNNLVSIKLTRLNNIIGLSLLAESSRVFYNRTLNRMITLHMYSSVLCFEWIGLSRVGFHLLIAMNLLRFELDTKVSDN